MRIIDAHNHPEWLGHDLARTIENMDRLGIERMWLLSWECGDDEYWPRYHAQLSPVPEPGGPIPFARCLRYKERYPERFVLGFAPDARRADAMDRLEAAVSIHGVQVYGEVKTRTPLDNPDCLRLFRACGEKSLPVTIHLEYEFDGGDRYPRPGWWYGGTIEAFERALRACPETVFLGHGPGFWAHLSGDDGYAREAYPKGPIAPGGKVSELLRGCPNLYLDLSAGSALNALGRDLEFSRAFLLEFQDRALFARDGFDTALKERLDSLELPASALEKILAGNAARLVT